MGVILLSACVSSQQSNRNPAAVPKLSCDSSIAAHFKPNDETHVLLVNAYSKGDDLPLSSEPEWFDTSKTALADKSAFRGESAIRETSSRQMSLTTLVRSTIERADVATWAASVPMSFEVVASRHRGRVH
jgi:hypothetical protein